MAFSPAKFVLLATIVAGFHSTAIAEAVDGETSDPAAASTITPPAMDAYKLKLANPDDYRVKVSADYLLAEAWRKFVPAPVPAPEPAPVIAIGQPAVDLPFHDEVLAAARTTGIEPALVHAVIRVKSNYNAAAASPEGAVGLMQLMPDTARRYGVKNSRDPVENIRGGAQYLVDLQRMFDNNLKLLLAAYNAGENAVLRYGHSIPPFAETRQYVPRVLAEYQRLRALLK